MSVSAQPLKADEHLASLQVKKAVMMPLFHMGQDETPLLYPAQNVRWTMGLHERLKAARHFSYHLAEVIAALHGRTSQSMSLRTLVLENRIWGSKRFIKYYKKKRYYRLSSTSWRITIYIITWKVLEVL